MSIRLYQPADQQRWDTYVSQQKGTHGYHQSGWARVTERAFGQQPYYLLSEDADGRIDGIFPLVRLNSRLFGDFLVSLPYLNYGGPHASSAEIEKALIAKAVQIAREEKVDYLELRLIAGDDIGLKVKSSKVSMRLPLTGDADALWKSFPSKLRSQIGRPLKEGMIAKFGGLDELDNFHRVFSVNMRDVGTPVYGKSFFANVLKEFPETARICNIYYKDEPVAGGFVFGFGDILEIPWASSLRAFNKLSPNMLLYHSVLQYACGAGYKVFDFGRSTPGGGTFRFKQQWGAEPLPLHWHYWLPNGAALPELNPNNPKYQLAINVWKRLPVGLTKLVGPMIVKNIP